NYVFSFAAVFKLRRSMPDAPRPYKALGYPYTTGFSLLGGTAFLVGAIVTDRRNSTVALGLLAASYPIYALTMRAARKRATPGRRSRPRSWPRAVGRSDVARRRHGP